MAGPIMAHPLGPSNRKFGVICEKMAAREIFLRVSKAFGLFRLARRFTARGLRILCYHSVSLENEHTFLPKMFVSPQTFEKRLAFLASRGFPILPLGEAIGRLGQGTLPAGATAITFDDALYGTYRRAWPLLRRSSVPVTLYVTTYYVAKRTPVFGLLVEYLFWTTKKPTLDLAGLGLSGDEVVRLTDPTARARALAEIVELGETRATEHERGRLARTLAERLDIDYDRVARERLFNLVTAEEIQELAAAGVDVEAHTHRHQFPENEAVVLKELGDNRAELEPLTGRRLEHFCYPSGFWSERHWPWLRAAGFRTATTCEPGFNYSDTPPLALRRFLDGEHISDLEFEAEMCGFKEMLRRGRTGLRRTLRWLPVAGGRSRAGQAWTSS
jgi:peptidoglycan/xylan/chitin deacetylase (PgdA/CDA1 family)